MAKWSSSQIYKPLADRGKNTLVKVKMLRQKRLRRDSELKLQSLRR